MIVSKTVKAILLFFTTLVYVALTWIVFKPPLSFSYYPIWIWLISIFLLLGIGFRVITNKFYGNFFVSYILLGVAGAILVLFLGANAISLPIFNKSGYESLAQIKIANIEDYEMSEEDLLFIPSDVAKRKVAKELTMHVSENAGFILSDGCLQKVKNDFFYVYSLEHKDKKSDSPGFAMLNAKTGEFIYKETKIPMSYSPYKKGSENFIKMIKKRNGNIPVSEAHLEIDDKMNPVWIAYGSGSAVSILGGKTTKEIYLGNPFTGDISTMEIVNIPEWVDYKISLNLASEIFNKASKSEGLINSNPLIIPRENKLYAMYNLSVKGKINSGVVFMDLDTGAAKVYPVVTVSSDRITECVSAWENSEQLSTYNVPVLSVLDQQPIFTFPMFDKNGFVQSYLFIDGKEGSFYASGDSWDAAEDQFMKNYKKQNEEQVEEEKPKEEQQSKEEKKPSKTPILDNGKGEGTLYSLINGFIETIDEDQNHYIITIYPWKTKFYITKDLASLKELELGKTQAITLQYPMEYAGKEIVYDCVPVPDITVKPN